MAASLIPAQGSLEITEGQDEGSRRNQTHTRGRGRNQTRPGFAGNLSSYKSVDKRVNQWSKRSSTRGGSVIPNAAQRSNPSTLSPLPIRTLNASKPSPEPSDRWRWVILPSIHSHTQTHMGIRVTDIRGKRVGGAFGYLSSKRRVPVFDPKGGRVLDSLRRFNPPHQSLPRP